MVADAVGIEPVSTPKFPVKQGICREFDQKGDLDGAIPVGCSGIFNGLRANSLGREAGNFSPWIRELRRTIDDQRMSNIAGCGVGECRCRCRLRVSVEAHRSMRHALSMAGVRPQRPQLIVARHQLLPLSFPRRRPGRGSPERLASPNSKRKQ